MHGFANDPAENRDGTDMECECGDDAVTTRPVYQSAYTYIDVPMCQDCATDLDNYEPDDPDLSAPTARERLGLEMEEGHRALRERRR